MTIQDVSRLLSSTRWQLETVNSTYANIMLVAMDLLTNVTMSQTEVDNTQQVNCQTLILLSSNLSHSTPLFFSLLFLPPSSFFLPPLPLPPSSPSPSLTHSRCSMMQILPSTVQTSLP